MIGRFVFFTKGEGVRHGRSPTLSEVAWLSEVVDNIGAIEVSKICVDEVHPGYIE